MRPPGYSGRSIPQLYGPMTAVLFPLGMVVATPGAIQVLKEEGRDWHMNAAVYLARHQDCDWGDISFEDTNH